MEILKNIISYTMKLIVLELLIIIVVLGIIFSASVLVILLPLLLLSSRAKFYSQGVLVRLKRF